MSKDRITVLPRDGVSQGTDAEWAAARVVAKAPAIFAMVFGAFMVLGLGFAHSTSIHNAAHDSRHSNIFPCH